jgi:hypothetical protein
MPGVYYLHWTQALEQQSRSENHSNGEQLALAPDGAALEPAHVLQTRT